MTDRLARFSIVLVALAGCEKRVDSPKLSLASIAPPIVCDVQLMTSETLMGANLTPLPIRTLGGTSGGTQPPSLQLPAITLTPSATLAGMPMSGAPVIIPDSVDQPMTSHVQWQSEAQMSFDVYPGLMLMDGIYDVAVANPDGQTATLTHALAAVPAPSVKMIVPPSICDAQSDQTIMVIGTGFLVVAGAKPTVTFTSASGMVTRYSPTAVGGCSDVAASVMSGVQLCTSMTIVIKKGDLQPGTYTVSVTNPTKSAGCSSAEMITVIIAPPPTLGSVSPMTICQGGGALDIKGTSFAMTPTVTLGTTMGNPVKFMSSSEVTAVFGGGNAMFTPGMKYDLTLTNPDGCSATLPGAVTALAGPVLFFVDPPVVWNGITTQVTMYATSIAPPLASVTIALSAGGPPKTLMAIIDPNHPKRILAEIPMGLTAGAYDVTVTDASGCPATLPKGITVVDKTTLTLTAIAPPFGWQGGTTAVTITAPAGLAATPRAYLNPHNAGVNTVATALGSVAFVSATKVTAIVPKGLDPAADPYDLIVINPDGAVGVLLMAYQSEVNPPPVIDSISPGSVTVPTGSALITLRGANFRQPTVTMTCNGAVVPAPTITSATATSIAVDVMASVNAVAPPGVCILRVTDGDDMSYADFSALAVAGASGKLSASTAGTDLPEARRAVSLVANQATSAARFLYAIGGDNGTPAGAFATVDTITADQNGVGAAWFVQRYKLSKPRTLAGAATLGRYIYVVGGNDGVAPVKTVERAIVLDPLQAPVITDVDIVPGGGMGLGGGVWYYRVAALMDPNDPDNPGGETLPSDETTLQIPDLVAKLQITISFGKVTGAVGYRIYRSPAAGMISGQEQHIADVVGGNTLSYTDQGATPIANDPLPLVQGSTGAWRPLPSLATRRESPGVAFGTDPATPTLHYLYATFGKDNAALGSYEYLAVTVGNGGAQAVANAWTQGAQTATPRYQHAVYSVDNAIASNVPKGSDYIFVGGGTTNGSVVLQALDAGKVAAGGDLGAFVATGKTIKHFGTGFVPATNYLYSFGSESATTSFDDAFITNAPPAVSVVNNNGSGLLTGRYLPGTALLGALIYLAGGSDATQTSAMKSVEWLVY